MKPANYAPIYAAALYPQWAEIAREHGYALAVHGSLARDFDLVAIPWADNPRPPEALLDELTTKFACKLVGGPPTLKPHGRLAYSLSIGFGECFADLSFMPAGQLQAALAFLEAWEHENHLHNMASTDNETYFAAAVKTAERALEFRLALPHGVQGGGSDGPQ